MTTAKPLVSELKGRGSSSQATDLLRKAVKNLRQKRSIPEVPSHTRTIRLFSLVASLVRILPDGRVFVTPDKKDTNTHILMESYGAGRVRFRSKDAYLFLAMDSKGVVYTTSQKTDESLFLERLNRDFHHTFESEKYKGFYLGFRKNGWPKKGMRTKPSSQNALFQVMYL